MNASSSPLSAPTTHTMEGVVYIPSSPSPESSLVTSWLGVVTVRAVLCVISWLLTVWVTRTDRLQGQGACRNRFWQMWGCLLNVNLSYTYRLLLWQCLRIIILYRAGLTSLHSFLMLAILCSLFFHADYLRNIETEDTRKVS